MRQERRFVALSCLTTWMGERSGIKGAKHSCSSILVTFRSTFYLENVIYLLKIFDLLNTY